MARTIKINLNFRENGKPKTKTFDISFVPKGRLNEYNKWQQIVFDVKSAWDRMSDIRSLIMAERVGKNIDKAKIKSLTKEIEELTSKIAEYEHDDLYLKGFELFNKILDDNGYKTYDIDWFNNCVEPDEIYRFNDKAIFKDIEKKNPFLM